MATKAKVEKAKKTDNADTNRMKRLLRTQKAQPNNKQIDAALKTTKMHRKTPTNPTWTATWRRIATLMREVTGRFDPSCMSSNPEIARAAMAKPGPATLAYKPLTLSTPKQGLVSHGPFSIGARIYGGAASWN
jgi:hypothetical protein